PHTHRGTGSPPASPGRDRRAGPPAGEAAPEVGIVHGPCVRVNRSPRCTRTHGACSCPSTEELSATSSCRIVAKSVVAIAFTTGWQGWANSTDGTATSTTPRNRRGKRDPLQVDPGSAPPDCDAHLGQGHPGTAADRLVRRIRRSGNTRLSISSGAVHGRGAGVDGRPVHGHERGVRHGAVGG